MRILDGRFFVFGLRLSLFLSGFRRRRRAGFPVGAGRVSGLSRPLFTAGLLADSGSLVVPSVVGLFTTVFLFLTCWLIANLFGLNQTRDIALLSGLLVTHETLVVSGATYLPWMDVYALSLFFAVLGAYLFMSGGRRAWLSPVFFFLSLGLYQSYLPCAAALMILALARQTLDGKRPGHVFARGLSGLSVPFWLAFCSTPSCSCGRAVADRQQRFFRL